MTLAMPGVCSAGLTMTVLPVTSAATVMPQQIASGKFQGLMTTATPRGWCHCLVELADEPPEAGALEEGGQAGVVLAEVDGLADVGVGLAPGLAGLLDHDAGEAVALLRIIAAASDQHRGSAPAGRCRATPGTRRARRSTMPGPARACGRWRPWAPGRRRRRRTPRAAREGEVAHRLVEERAAVAHALRPPARAGGARRAGDEVGLAGWSPALGAGAASSAPTSALSRKPAFSHDSLRCSRAGADEVRHAGDHLADGHVLADAQAHVGGGVLELVGHAVEHLELEGLAGQAALLERGERRAMERTLCEPSASLTPALRVGPIAPASRRGASALGQASRKTSPSLEAARRSATSRPHGAGPALLLGVMVSASQYAPLTRRTVTMRPGALGPVADPRASSTPDLR
jgi:hypothetical protein